MVTREMIRRMPKGAVVVDVSIDQGGCVEGIRQTTHTDPTYVEDGIVFSAIPNLPGVVPLTSTRALARATLPFVKAIARDGWKAAARKDAGLAKGVGVTEGHVTDPIIAETFGLPYNPLSL
jgi:alanine dehydrogenase